MLQRSILVVWMGLVCLSISVPITDHDMQRNALYPSVVRGSELTVPHSKMRPYRRQNDENIQCTSLGYFSHPKNCSNFYRCVDIAETGMYSTVFFECAAGTVFSKELATCVPGICLNQALPQGPVLMNPTISSQSLGLDSGSASEGSLPPSPPPPPPPSTTNPPPPPPTTTPAPPVTIGSTAIQIPVEAFPFPAWFNSTPWWFKTPPAWFHQPPAWFNADKTQQVITEEIVIDENLTYPNSQAIGNKSNFSVGGIDSSLSKDNKTIRIYIPIRIVQQ